MRKFINKPSALYSQAVGALSTLIEAEGVDAALRAYAQATWEEHQEQYAKNHGLRPSKGRICLARLLGKRCDFHSDHSGVPCRPPGADHDSLWLKDGKPYTYTSQPYSLTLEEMRALVALCDRHGLEVSVTTWPSWHFPGGVLTMEIRRKEEKEKPSALVEVKKTGKSEAPGKEDGGVW